MLWVALEYFQNPKFHNPSSKIEWTTAIWRYEVGKVKVLRKWHCRTAMAVPIARVVQMSNGLFRMFGMIHKYLLMPWNHIQIFFPVPLLTDWLVEGHLSWFIIPSCKKSIWSIFINLWLLWKNYVNKWFEEGTKKSRRLICVLNYFERRWQGCEFI